MGTIRATIRFLLIALVIFLGAVSIAIFSVIPLKLRGIRLSVWPIMGMARAAIWVLNGRVECYGCEKVWQLDGFLFPNHRTYYDILVVGYLMPVRYVAKQKVASYPFIGYMAKSVHCVFVDRRNKASRAQARRKLAEIDHFPPIVIYPEGTRGPGDQLLPFRYGAFEIAVQGRVPFMPCAIMYDDPERVLRVGKESIPQSAWRLAKQSKPLHVKVFLLDEVRPTGEDDPVQLAEQTQAAMEAVLVREGNYKRMKAAE